MLAKGNLLNDRYLLTAKLGDNFRRQTWLATDRQLQKSVIVKLLVFGAPMQWQDLNLFEREAKILQQLDNPRVPKYLDYFTVADDGDYFALVQSYIAGNSLQDLLDRGQRFTELDLRSIAEQILEVLVYLHGLNPPVLHRDLKPSNIIFGDDNSIYLIDFGAVQIQAPTPGKNFTVVGTYGYTAIEQFGGRAVPASDLYSLGCTLIHLATGISPGELPQKQGKLDFRALTNLDRNFIKWLELLSDPLVDKRPYSAKIARKYLLEKPQNNRSLKLFLPEQVTNFLAQLPTKSNRLFFAQKFGLNANQPPAKSQILCARAGEIFNITIPPSQRADIRLSEAIALAILSLLFLKTYPLLLFSLIFLLLIFKYYPVLTTVNLNLEPNYLSIICKFTRFNFTLLKVAKNEITQVNFICDRQKTRGLIYLNCGKKKHILRGLAGCSVREKAWITLILSKWSGLPVSDRSLNR